MKKYIAQVFLLGMILIGSCGKKSEDYKQTKDKLNSMVNELNSKFTENAVYHSIMFSFDEAMGNTIFVKMTENLDSAKLQEWFYFNGQWEFKSDIKLETDSLKIVEQVFSLKNDYDISKLADMLYLASEKLEDEKDVMDGSFKSINLLMGNQGIAHDKMENFITQITIESVLKEKSYFVNLDIEGNIIAISE